MILRSIECIDGMSEASRPHSVPPLYTRRLVLAPLAIEDAEQIQALFPHAEMVRYMTVVPWPYPPDGALTYIRDAALPAMARGEEWQWSIRLRDDPARLIGCAGLRANSESNRGFWIGKAWQRQGFMTEAVDAITDFWFDVLGFERLRAYKAIENVGSRRISEKNGMRVVGSGEHEFAGGRFPSEMWEITAREWRTRRSLRG
jgi:[ribosomal protein S5]-alanine N-acetyltransferase